jgi:hypothetical protein
MLNKAVLFSEETLAKYCIILHTTSKFSTSSRHVLRISDVYSPFYHITSVCPRTGHKGPEGEQRYSSTLSLTLALDGGV